MARRKNSRRTPKGFYFNPRRTPRDKATKWLSLMRVAKETAQKATWGQEQDEIDALSQDILEAWIETRPDWLRLPLPTVQQLRALPEVADAVRTRRQAKIPFQEETEFRGAYSDEDPFELLALTSAQPDTADWDFCKPTNSPAVRDLEESDYTEERSMALMYRLHEGESIFPGKGRYLTKRIRYGNTKLRPQFTPQNCPQAYADLYEYHVVAGGKSGECPSCKRIAKLVSHGRHRVKPEQVESIINYVLRRMYEWKEDIHE